MFDVIFLVIYFFHSDELFQTQSQSFFIIRDCPYFKCLLLKEFSQYQCFAHLHVYIYIRQLGSFRAPTLQFINLTVATCHIQYTFLSLCQFVSRENGQNTKNTRSPPFSHDIKMAPDGLLGVQSINTESAPLRPYLHLNSLLPCLSDDTTTVQSSTRTQSCSQKTCLLSSTCQSGPASGSEVLTLWCQQSYNIFRCLCSELGADKMQT